MNIFLVQNPGEQVPSPSRGLRQDLPTAGMTLVTNGGYPGYALAMAERVHYDRSGVLLDVGSPAGLVTFMGQLWGRSVHYVSSDLRLHNVVLQNFRLNRLNVPNLSPVARLADCTRLALTGTPPNPKDVSQVILSSHVLDVTQALDWIKETPAIFPRAELTVLARRQTGRRRILEVLQETYEVVTELWTDGQDDAAVYRAEQPTSQVRVGTVERASERQHTLELPGNKHLLLTSLPGLFSHRGIDDGSKALVDEVNVEVENGGTHVDLGCGYGPIGLSVALLRPAVETWCVDVDLRAVAAAQSNALANGIKNVRFAWSNGWSVFDGQRNGVEGHELVPANSGQHASFGLSGLEKTDSLGPLHLVTANPPFHEEYSVPKSFIEGAHRRLIIGGRIYLAIKRPRWYENKLRSTFGGCRRTLRGDYTVLMAEKR